MSILVLTVDDLNKQIMANRKNFRYHNLEGGVLKPIVIGGYIFLMVSFFLRF